MATLTLKIGHARFTVASIEEGSRTWCAHRDVNGLGGSDSPQVWIIEPAGRKLRVSYNGRVWSDSAPDASIVYDPLGVFAAQGAP